MIWAITLGVIAGMIISRFYTNHQNDKYLNLVEQEQEPTGWTADQYYWTMKKIQEETHG